MWELTTEIDICHTTQKSNNNSQQRHYADWEKVRSREWQILGPRQEVQDGDRLQGGIAVSFLRPALPSKAILSLT